MKIYVAKYLTLFGLCSYHMVSYYALVATNGLMVKYEIMQHGHGQEESAQHIPYHLWRNK